jgi:hypothetical protein
MPKSRSEHCHKCVYSSWRPFEQCLKGICRLFGKCMESIGLPFHRYLYSSRYTLGNAQIKVEPQWTLFPAVLQPIGNKETPSYNRPPRFHIFSMFSVYFFEAPRLLNLVKIGDVTAQFKNNQQYFSYFCFYFWPNSNFKIFISYYSRTIKLIFMYPPGFDVKPGPKNGSKKSIKGSLSPKNSLKMSSGLL